LNSAANMCTDFLLADGTENPKYAVAGRSMEFGTDLNAQIVVQAAGSTITQLPPGAPIQVKHGFVGMTAIKSSTFTIEGFNDKGFSVGGLWLPAFTKYPKLQKPYDQAVNAMFIVDYLLATFETCGDVITQFNSATPPVNFWGLELEEKHLPLHFAMHDAKGKTAVIEFLETGISVTDNPSNVLTNSPPLTWHLNNLGNYAGASYETPKPIKVGKMHFPMSGQGGGMSCIPGDSFPASRFVRTFYNVKFAMEQQPPADAAGAVNLAYHILNLNDIPKGVSLTPNHIPSEYDYTQWAVVKDLKNLNLYVRTYGGLGVYVVNLTESLTRAAGGRLNIPIPQFVPVSLTAQLDNLKHSFVMI